MNKPKIRTRLFDSRFLSFPLIIPGVVPVVLPLNLPIIIPLDIPIRIVKIDKVAEVVGLKNTGNKTIDLTGWNMVSVASDRNHPIEGILEAGKTRYFANMSGKKVWSSEEKDDGALYNAQGQLVSYWNDF